MSTIERTAYPRYSKRRKIRQKDLDEFYTLSSDEVDLMNKCARKSQPKLNFAIQLKTFQKLGYFIPINEVPEVIIFHLKKSLRFHHKTRTGYDELSPTTLYTHRNVIRTYLKIIKWEYQKIEGRRINAARKSAIKFAYNISHNMNNIADIISAVVQHLIESGYELPSFHTLDQLVRHTRHIVNNKIFNAVSHKIILSGTDKSFTKLLQVENSHSLFNDLKKQPKRPSINRFRDFLKHYEWLCSLGDINDFLSEVATIKVELFAEEAKNLTVDEMKKISPSRQYTLIASLISKSQAVSKDALTSMLCRMVASAHKSARNELDQKLEDNKTDSCEVADILMNIVGHSKITQQADSYGSWVFNEISKSGGADAIIDKCKDVIISHSNEHRLFLSQKLMRNRSLLYSITQRIDPKSSTAHQALINALIFILDHQNDKPKYFNNDVDLSFATEFWKNRIHTNVDGEVKLNRKELETSVFEFLSKGLNSGDVYIDGANNYADYRAELLPWDECKKHLNEFCQQVNIPNNPLEMVKILKKDLIEKAEYVDQNYHNIADFIISDEGIPCIKKYDPKPASESAQKLESIIKSRMPERSLLDVLSNSEYYVNWTAECGSLDGSEPKLDNPVEKYILTTFAKGTGLGLNQTSRHIRNEVSPRILSRVNQKHFSIKSLNKSLTKIIDCINQFELPKAWGDGKRCAVDGTMEDINDDNIIAEPHFRYRKKGGVAYHHVADNYIALFSTFIQCGVWEAIHIIDGLLQNASEIQPKIVHSDTQGQSLPVFAFAYLFGITLMPRIRHWKNLKIYRPEKESKYKNIDDMFCDAWINWDVILTHWQDLMQVIISVKMGKVSSSFMLNKLNSYNYKNRLYKAFQELGKVIRTIFLLDYVSDMNLRQNITNTTNKAEAYNGLSDWVRFGAKKLVATNDPDEMEKSIKYNQIITNSIMLQDVIDITNILHELKDEGYKYTKDDVSYLSPYIREHLKRFGEYVLDLNKKPAKIDGVRDREVF
ncbi:Tn3 family transposase [Thiotrichales bacterium 19S11-10]|nr:Tn3 family transposase [Thiotrichales bacterium 19S11-10]